MPTFLGSGYSGLRNLGCMPVCPWDGGEVLHYAARVIWSSICSGRQVQLAKCLLLHMRRREQPSGPLLHRPGHPGTAANSWPVGMSLGFCPGAWTGRCILSQHMNATPSTNISKHSWCFWWNCAKFSAPCLSRSFKAKFDARLVHILQHRKLGNCKLFTSCAGQHIGFTRTWEHFICSPGYSSKCYSVLRTAGFGMRVRCVQSS